MLRLCFWYRGDAARVRHILSLSNRVFLFRTNVVADAIMKMIQDGKNGDNWVVEGGEPPYAVQMQHYSTSK